MTESSSPSATFHASCLCGRIRWEVDAPFGSAGLGGREVTESERLLSLSHCHCSRCRKFHGGAHGSYVIARAERFRLVADGADVVRYTESRCFCRHCGSVVPDGHVTGGWATMPAGNFEGDIGVRPTAHIFYASRAPWFVATDDLPQFARSVPGFDIAALPDTPLGARGEHPRGSCLCGSIAYEVPGPVLRCRACHCSRCRLAGSAPFVAYIVTPFDGVRFTRGETEMDSYKPAGARFFRHAFCRTCGASMPRKDAERNLTILPMGTLDDDPGVRLQGHIFVRSKAPWDAITDGLPQVDNPEHPAPPS